MFLLCGCQLLCKVGDHLLPLWAHLPASRRKQQVAVSYIPDCPLQLTNLLLRGRKLRLELLILRLEFVVVASLDASSQECDRKQRCDKEALAGHLPVLLIL
jgi:hypothetical protein